MSAARTENAAADSAGRRTAAGRIHLASPDATRRLGERIGSLARAGDLVLLTGELGAGKTTLTQGIGAGLNVRGAITSPTFIVARHHPSLTGGPALVHVDAYRIESLEDLETLDLDTSLDEAVTVVEWGTGLVERLSQDRLEVVLDRPHGAATSIDPDGADTEQRTATLIGWGVRGAELVRAALPESTEADPMKERQS